MINEVKFPADNSFEITRYPPYHTIADRPIFARKNVIPVKVPKPKALRFAKAKELSIFFEYFSISNSSFAKLLTVLHDFSDFSNLVYLSLIAYLMLVNASLAASEASAKAS